MLPAATWLLYVAWAYLGWAIYFRLRYDRSPVAERFPPRSLYEAVDWLLCASVGAYSVWIVRGPPGHAISIAGGLAVVVLGAALRLWAVVTLGPNWRIGQDAADSTAAYVASGPYRLMHHPINTALVLVAIGQALLTGLDVRAMFLLAVATAYWLVQGLAEERHWKKRLENP